MLELVPRLSMSQRYSVRRDGIEVAEVDLAWWKEGGRLEVEGGTYGLRREGVKSGAFTLSQDGQVLVAAHKPSALRNRFEVEHDGQRYELVKAGWWMRRFELRAGGSTVGSVAPLHPFTRRARVSLPGELPLPVKVFLAALVALMWRRGSSGAAAGGAGGG